MWEAAGGSTGHRAVTSWHRAPLEPPACEIVLPTVLAHRPRATRTPPGRGEALALLAHKLGALPSSRCPLFSLFSWLAA